MKLYSFYCFKKHVDNVNNKFKEKYSFFFKILFKFEGQYVNINQNKVLYIVVTGIYKLPAKPDFKLKKTRLN